jgi:drug/metabolite transporter (DMT)-like permease
MIFAVAPVLVVLLARVTLGERIEPRRRGGVAIALAGAAIVAAAQGVGDGGSLLGAALVVAAVCCYAPWVILSKRAARTMRPHDIAAWSTWLAAIMTLPAGSGLMHDVAHVRPSAIVAAVFLGVVVTTLPLVLWTWVLARVPASIASASLLLVGPSAVLISWIVLAETPAVGALIGGAITLGGVAIAQLPSGSSVIRARCRRPFSWAGD